MSAERRRVRGAAATFWKQHTRQTLADEKLTEKLSYAGVVCIRGPKWCGKTTTAEQHAWSALYMQDPDEAIILMLADTCPSFLLRGERPRLVDE